VTEVEPAATRARPVWYAVEGRDETAVAMIAAMEASGRANQELQRRLRTASGLGETDTVAVLYLLTASAEGELVTPKDLAAHLRSPPPRRAASSIAWCVRAMCAESRTRATGEASPSS